MICYLKTSPATYDGRLKKYLIACKHAKIPYIAITWDRMINRKLLENEYSYEKRAPFGYGQRFHNFLCLIGWYIFVIKKLISHKNEYEIIHACNLVTAIVAFPMKVLLNKKMIFDIYDTSGKIWLEHFFIKHSDLLILPHEKRLQQINISRKDIKNFLEIENVPIFPAQNFMHENFNLKDKIRLSYVGTFERINRGLENVLKFVLEDERFIWEIAGSGSGLETLFEESAKKCNRIIYHGRVTNEEGIEIMKRSDFIVALYYLTSQGHLYASPNKLYESLYLSVPIITSKNTLVGNQVEQYDSGYTVEDSYEALVNLFNNVDNTFIDCYKQKVQNARKIWNDNYANYLEKQLINKYIYFCQKNKLDI